MKQKKIFVRNFYLSKEGEEKRKGKRAAPLYRKGKKKKGLASGKP